MLNYNHAVLLEETTNYRLLCFSVYVGFVRSFIEYHYIKGQLEASYFLIAVLIDSRLKQIYANDNLIHWQNLCEIDTISINLALSKHWI